MNTNFYLSRKQYRTIGAALFVGLLWVMMTPNVLAGPVEPSPVELTQPDGTIFSADPFGDEWNNGMEYSGYTIMQSPLSKYWVYAELASNGELRTSEHRVGIDAPPLGLDQHVRDMTAIRPINTMPRLPYAPDDWPGVMGSQPVLVLLVDFTPSTSVGTTAAQWNAAIFDDTASAKSVKNAYDEASYNQFTITPVAETQGTANDGIIEVTLGYAHPNTATSTGDPNRQLTKDALIAADAFINYSTYDTNSSGGLDVTELHIIVIPRGYETSFGSSSACSPSVWGHRWSLWGGISGPSLDSVTVGDFNFGGGYMQFGEWQDTTGGAGCPGSSDGNMATIGIIAHELGHDINWPDLYDTSGGSDGVGYWSLMGSGSWGRASGENAGTTPTLPDAFSRIYQKWVTPMEVTSNMTDVDIAHASASASVYQIGTNNGGVDWHFGTSSGTGEYFLIENRMQTGFDAGLYRIDSSVGGCVIWHIDETRTSSNLANADQTRRLIDVVEANTTQDLDSVGARGDTNDVWPGANNYVLIGPATPTNNFGLYDGGVVDVTVSGITASGSTGCQVDFSVGTFFSNHVYLPILRR